MSISLHIEFEKAVRLLVAHVPPSNENSRKPILFHNIRVGVYLYEHGYPQDIILAGVLHDAIEWSSMTEQMLRDEFGENVVRLVLACTKNDSITDDLEKTKDLILRCVKTGQEALVVKSADILDSFKWYSSQNNDDEIKYCVRNAEAIFKFKPADFNDNIFSELRSWLTSFTESE